MRIFFITKTAQHDGPARPVNMTTYGRERSTIIARTAALPLKDATPSSKGIIIMRTGAAMGHTIIRSGKLISLNRPILLPRFDSITFRRLNFLVPRTANPEHANH